MKKLDFKILITGLVFGLTLFASTEVTAAGGGGGGVGDGGGGSAILCNGHRPELTEFWELARYAPAIVNGPAGRLNQLRDLDADAAGKFLTIRQGFVGDKYWYERMTNELKDLLVATKKAITEEPARETVRTSVIGLHISVQVDRNQADPKDSGAILGLDDESARQENCKEERVAVSHYEAWQDSNQYASLSIVIKNPEVFMAMAPIDQLALLWYHEYNQAEQQGKLSLGQVIAEIPRSSVDTRKYDMWQIFATQREWASGSRVDSDKKFSLVCSAIPFDVQDPESIRNRVWFNLIVPYRGSASFIEIENYKNQDFQNAPYGAIEISRDQLLLREGLDYKINAGDVATELGFLRMKLNKQRVTSKIVMNVPSLKKVEDHSSPFFFERGVPTGFRAIIEKNGAHQVMLKIQNEMTNEISFVGNVKCNYRNPKSQL